MYGKNCAMHVSNPLPERHRPPLGATGSTGPKVCATSVGLCCNSVCCCLKVDMRKLLSHGNKKLRCPKRKQHALTGNVTAPKLPLLSLRRRNDQCVGVLVKCEPCPDSADSAGALMRPSGSCNFTLVLLEVCPAPEISSRYRFAGFIGAGVIKQTWEGGTQCQVQCC
eukprot:jgi/Chrzof1/6116/Cz17g10110.t1